MPTAQTAPDAIAAVLDLLFPALCACCAKRPAEAGEPRILCTRCERLLASQSGIREPGPPGTAHLVGVGPYDGIAGELVRAIKFSRRLVLARPAAEALASVLADGLSDWSVVPVPPSPLRWRVRGFDPAEELAVALARVTGRPYARCLRRTNGPRQAGRSRSRRLAAAPQVHARGPVPDLCLLVDDVVTTGATARACADALRLAGCSRVSVACLARAGTRYVAPPVPSGL